MGYGRNGGYVYRSGTSGEHTLGAGEKLIYREGDVYSVSDAANQWNLYVGDNEFLRADASGSDPKLSFLRPSDGMVRGSIVPKGNLNIESQGLTINANGAVVSVLDDTKAEFRQDIQPNSDGAIDTGGAGLGIGVYYVAESASAPASPTTAAALYVVDDGGGVKQHRVIFANGTDELLRDHSGNTSQSGKATIGGDLDHDGSNVGFYGIAPTSQPTALTAEDSSTVDDTYGTQERDVIQNTRTRVGELESKLQALGLIA